MDITYFTPKITNIDNSIHSVFEIHLAKLIIKNLTAKNLI